ncbi:MAG: hypothetical protein JW891_18590 [Candidatus Lokiarchaeota archaeon]|nr:hypothetical protein [Candidatus Lokiarchaeota archaeon]
MDKKINRNRRTRGTRHFALLIPIVLGLMFFSVGTISSIDIIFNKERYKIEETTGVDRKLSVSVLESGEGIPICSADGYQFDSHLIRDDNGGYIFVWTDNRNGNYDIYCQRVDSEGNSNWGTNGAPICTLAENQMFPEIVGDITGGAIVAWLDNRSGNGYEIYAQKIDSSGNLQWSANGVLLSNRIAWAESLKLTSDNNGGAIATWSYDLDGVGFDIYAQRITSDGQVNWTANGIPICDLSGTQSDSCIVSDDVGGAVIFWDDSRIGNDGIYAQRVNLTGHAQWDSNGTAVCSVLNERGCYPRAINDGTGTGNVIVTWCDYRSENYDSFAQKINSTGHAQWLPEGVPICTALTHRDHASPLVGDGAGGAIIAWDESRVLGLDSSDLQQVYAQRITSDGQVNWTTNGVPICEVPGYQTSTQVASDYSGGAVIAWVDDRNSDIELDHDIYAQKINIMGHIQWEPNGTAICRKPGWQVSPQLVGDGYGGIIISWIDHRDIYAQRFNFDAKRQWSLSSDSPTISGFDLSILGSFTLICLLSISVILIKTKRMRKD